MRSYAIPFEAMRTSIEIIAFMKRNLATVTVSLLFAACFQEEVIPVSTRFDFAVKDNDYSIPVAITFDNRTTGAENYQWTFEGGEPATSDKRDPGTIVFAKE